LDDERPCSGSAPAYRADPAEHRRDGVRPGRNGARGRRGCRARRERRERHGAVPGLGDAHLLRHDDRGDPGADGAPDHATGVRATDRGGLLGIPELARLMDAEPAVASRAVAVGSRWRRARDARLPGEARRIGYLYVAPAFLLYAAFNLFPLGQGVNLSFYQWDGITPGTWVGLDNYLEFFTDPIIRQGYVHVLQLMVFYSFLPIVIGLFLAGLLSRLRSRC